jgi:SAM-dependent methyltransferase
MGRARVLVGLSGCLMVGMVGLWLNVGAQPRQPDVEYVPTPHHVVAEMLRLAAVTPSDVVYDLGCGDGRVLIAAAQSYNARGVGVDIDPQRIEESRVNAKQASVVDRVRFLQQDLFETDIREATVVALYLLPQLNRQLRPKLFSDLRPGARVVSHDFDMGDWQPDQVIHVPGEAYEHTVFYWIIPANVDGRWQMNVSTPAGERRYLLRLQQRYQEIRGTVSAERGAVLITNATLTGERLRFTVLTGIQSEEVQMSFDGRVSGDAMRGSVEVHGGALAGRYDWTSQREATSPLNAPQR